MDILLLGRDDSITKTIEQMLCSESNWSIQRTNALNKQKWQRVKKLHDKKPFSIVLANLEGFSQPPHIHTRQIIRALPSVPLLVLHSYQKNFLIKPILDAGATGYVQNNISEEKLLQAIYIVKASQKHVFTKTTYWTSV